MSSFGVILFFLCCHNHGLSKIHHLRVRDDARTSIELTHFGYSMQGTMIVKIDNFTVEFPEGTAENKNGKKFKNLDPGDKIGFSLSRGDEVPEFVRTTQDTCLLGSARSDRMHKDLATVYFLFDFERMKLRIERHSQDLANLEVTQTLAYHLENSPMRFEQSENNTKKKATSKKKPALAKNKPKTIAKRRVEREQKKKSKNRSKSQLVHPDEVKEIFGKDDESKTTGGKSAKVTVASATASKTTSRGQSKGKGTVMTTPAPSTSRVVKPEKMVVELPLERGTAGNGTVRTEFAVTIMEKKHEGLYYFIYHNCRNYRISDFNKRMSVSFTIDIEEKNVNSFLSAGEVPKPSLYFGLSALFFATGILWIQFMRGTKENVVYRIHYLMAALVFIKSLSLLFHGVNFYFISVYGKQQEVWAVVFYIMHLLKGALLFGTIILIGTGYTFFKNFLTERDRKLFMIIIPLQVLDNIALVIIEESEEGQKNYRLWMQLFIFIDLICCLAIILPVIWSIRHLQEASQTDGKAAFNLEKLRLFRHFYILIICYVYLTRIIKYLVVFTVPFKHVWLVVVVEEVGTWLFFVVTGYKFKPAPDNPYLKLSQSDDEWDVEEPVTQSGVLEGVTKLKRGGSSYLDTSKGSPEGEELLGEDVLFEKRTRSSSSINAALDDGAGPDIY